MKRYNIVLVNVKLNVDGGAEKALEYALHQIPAHHYPYEVVSHSLSILHNNPNGVLSIVYSF